MGPFVPEIFSTELNYIFALIIGIAFGFSLEQSGFSSSRKLAGLFYGIDFTVLKVFFTAALTAMVGIIFLNYFGLLNLDLIYVNPTFLPSAIVGGAVMGLGFIIGGFCPGTSICAATIGKIDAMFYIIGIFLGTFTFTIGYPIWEDFFKSGFMGSISVYDAIGMSRGLFVFLIIIIAIAAFAITSKIEQRVSKLDEHPEKKYKKNYIIAIAASIVLAIIVTLLPDWKEKIISNATDEALSNNDNIEMMSPDELAFRIIDNDKNITIIDVREPEEFNKSNVVLSINIPVDSMVNTEWFEYIKNNPNTIIFYSNNEKRAKKAYFIAKEFGHDYNKVMTGGFNEYYKIFFTDKVKYNLTKNIQDQFNKKFRTKASIQLEEIRKIAAKNKGPKKKKSVKIVGGC